jgi:hypothetical protein
MKVGIETVVSLPLVGLKRYTLFEWFPALGYISFNPTEARLGHLFKSGATCAKAYPNYSPLGEPDRPQDEAQYGYQVGPNLAIKWGQAGLAKSSVLTNLAPCTAPITGCFQN